MADYNIAMGVKPPEPINYLGQAAQMMALRAAQDDLQGNEAVKQFYAQGGDLSTPEARARLKSLNPKFGMAAEKAQFDAQKTQAEIKKLEFDNIEKAFAQSREFLNGIDYTAPDAGEKMKAWHIANHKDPFLGPLLASRGIDPAQSLASIDAAIAKGPEGIRDALRNYSMGQKAFQDKLMSGEQAVKTANISAGPGWAQANLAREKWKDELSNPKTTLQIIGNRVFDRNPRTGALTEVMEPTNALAPAQPPASMVNNMLADRNPTAITSLPPPVMSPQAFDTTRPPAPAAGPRPLVVPDKPLFENAYSADVGKATAASDIKLIDAAKAALPNITKLDEIQSYINKADVTTGLGADIIKNVKRAQAQFLADKAAGKAASDTEILDSMLGAGVFPMIQSLGIGARGMDTPAEREFLRGVMAGTISMNKDTLTKLTQIRRDLEARAVDKYNHAIDRGELTPYAKVTGRKLDKIKVPDAPTKTVVRTGTLNGRKVNEYSDGTADYAD